MSQFSLRKIICIPTFANILAVSVVSCAPPRKNIQDKSKIKYGHTVGWEQITILTIPPGETIGVCDQAGGVGSDIVKAVKEWATAGGMDRHLDVREACGATYSIDATNDVCQFSAAAYTAAADQIGRWKIAYCTQSPFAKIYDIALHEVGHIFGQCDRYTKGQLHHPVQGSGCSDDGRSSDGMFKAPSAMQAATENHPHRVTEDDQKGLAALIARTDIGGADKWRAVIGTSGSTQNQSRTPSNPNSSIRSPSLPPTNGRNDRYPNNLPSSNYPVPPGNSQCVLMDQLGQMIPILKMCSLNGSCNFIESIICQQN